MDSDDWRSWNAHQPVTVVRDDGPDPDGLAVPEHDVGLPRVGNGRGHGNRDYRPRHPAVGRLRR